MLDFIKRLETLIKEEREKMIGKAVLYAENSEASNRNGYMTHKYAISIIKGVAEDYRQEIAKLLEKQQKAKQDKLVADRVEGITLMKEQKTKERNEAKKKAMDTPVIPINDSVEKKKSTVRKKPSPKKAPSKKKGSSSDKDK